MAHERLLGELDKRRAAARRMGGPEKLAQRAKRGQLNAQERLDALVDPGSFIELGLLGASALDADPDETPRDGKITGFGRIDGRDVGVVVNDFTVKGSSTSATNSRKMGYIRRACTERGLPFVHIGESTGARLPDAMGSKGMGNCSATTSPSSVAPARLRGRPRRSTRRSARPPGYAAAPTFR